jgi:hypothetical protein
MISPTVIFQTLVFQTLVFQTLTIISYAIIKKAPHYRGFIDKRKIMKLKNV